MSLFPVRIKNAHKYYNRGKSNELHVMDDVCLELSSSGMVAIFGKSGCGKTTLLNAIGGLDRIASGSIEVFGEDIRKDTDTLRNRYVGYIFQNYNLSHTETVFENVAAALRLCGMTDEGEISERVMAALANVDMAKYRDRTPDTLSGGQQQRVAIARAIVKNPAIILADEPTGNLDEANTVLVMDILKEISRSHLVLLVTHEANLVDYYCDRVIEIVDGHVHSDRQNEGADGYVQRNKNHIYLGELEKTETATPGVTLEYYGEPATQLTLQVVSVGGKLYLKANDPSVKILEEGSEIKLVEGVFSERPTEAAASARKLDMSKLTPVEGKNYGRLYHWKNSMVQAWRENFSTKQKKGKRLLRACLFLLAVVMVFTAATFGAGIRSYVELRRDHNESLFYIPLETGEGYAESYVTITESLGSHGMDHARIIGANPLWDSDRLQLRSAAFMTAKPITVSAEAFAMDVAHAEGLPLVAGEATLTGKADILITTALADRLLEASTVGYLDDYIDLVGMVSQTYHQLGGLNLRVAGVVRSDELFYYMDGVLLSEYITNNYFWLPVASASSVGMEGELSEGQLLFRENSGASDILKQGDKVEIMGLPFVVSGVLHRYHSISEYPDYVYKTYGEKLITTPEEYALVHMGADAPTEDAVVFAIWLLDYYGRYMQEFLEEKLSALMSYDDVPFEEWAVAKEGHIGAYASLMGYDPAWVCATYLYHKEHGHYPTEAELEDFRTISGVEEAISEMVDYKHLYPAYDVYMNQHWNSYSNEYYYVISDADYRKLAYAAGDSTLSDISGYHVWEQHDGEVYHSNHLMIRSSDPAATAAFLTDVLGEGAFISPDDVFDDLFREMRSTVLAGITGLAVILGLMCLCVFFIMRSSFMSRVREVGILRAIGVTKRNLAFRFAVETVLLVLLTVVIGFLLSAWFIGSLSDAVLFSELFYFPGWMALSLLAVILAVSILFGVLPALLLLRKTPSEILSKYDI